MDRVSDLRRDPTGARTPEMVGIQALLDLAVVIPGEDVAASGQHFRDLTTAVMRVLAEPDARRQDMGEELIERCRTRGWTLMFLKDRNGMIQKAIAVRPEALASMKRATESSSAQPAEAMVVLKHKVSGEKQLVGLSRSSLSKLQSLAQNDPLPAIPDVEEIHTLQINVQRQNLLLEMEEASKSLHQ